MLVLGGVAALYVAERRVRVDDAKVTEVLQSHQVLALPQAVQPAAAERQRPKVFVDDVQQVFGPGESAAHRQTGMSGNGDSGSGSRERELPYGHVSNVEVLHVM